MTIAAGFIYQNGVLLCADTELSGWAMTLHGRKVEHFKCPVGTVGMAYAGNRAFAVSAIQKCKRELVASSPGEALGKLERIIDKEYRRTVLSHPSHAIDPTLSYSLLIAICTQSGDLSLYATEQTATRQVPDYECIGIGEALAHYLVRPEFSMGMGERATLSLATFMLACVKGNVPGCGGFSQFVSIRKDGTAMDFMSGGSLLGSSLLTNTDWLERHSKGYDAFARKLLFDIPNPEVTDADFIASLNEFKKRMVKFRKDCRQSSRVHESFVDILNRQAKTRDLEDQLSQPQTTADPSRQQPSPESPEGSGES